MMRLHETVRRALSKALSRARGFRGNVDGRMGDSLIGWVAPSDGSAHALTVGLFTSRGLLVQAVANIHRADLEQAGIGAGQHGFALPLSQQICHEIAADGNRAEIRLIGRRNRLMARHRFDFDAAPGVAKARVATSEGLGQALFGDLSALGAMLERISANPPAPQRPPLERHGLIFAATDYVNGGSLPAPMAAYQDYVRYRNRYDANFDISQPDEARHFMRFYLDFFGPARGGLRIPLPRQVLERYNAPIPLDGHRFDLTHISWSYLADYSHLRQTMDLANPDWCFSLSYWWSIHQCHSLHAEDCLVPLHYIEVLAAIPQHWEGKPFPMTRFMHQFHVENGFLHGLDLDEADDRRKLALALMIKAVHRPDFLRYIPIETQETLLAPVESGGCALSEFAGKQSGAAIPAFSREDFAMAMRLQGFDLDSRAFLSITPEGHRFEAAMLPPVTGDEIVDVQMIGPFRKASGLGQATRLSAEILGRTPFSTNSVDFGLDNPAPEGFSRVGALSDYKRARINLIHLNAESIPLVYAYQPDVFSGAYNIGYFFWELDSPAACHFLGMDLLDEIWVSTEYGVQIYQPHTDRPVVNVGMCFEALPEIPRAEARDMVCKRFGFSGEEFVFLVAFDSFSFVQRKNPIGTLKAFKAAFPDTPDVRLVIKTQNRTKVADPVQIRIWEELDALIADDPRIVILDETLTYEDLLRLKKGCDCYVSLHRSEGWGFGMIEAMNLRVPVVCTAYSGNMDFCSEETAWLVDYTEVELGKDDYIFVRPGQKWAEPDIAHAAQQLRAVRAQPELRAAKAQAAWDWARRDFSAQAIARRYAERIEQILAESAPK